MAVSDKAAFGSAGAMELGGKTYILHKLRLKDMSDIQAWIDQQYPDPFRNLRSSLDLLDPGLPPQQPHPPKAEGPGRPISSEAKAKHQGEIAVWQEAMRRWEYRRTQFEDERRILLLNSQAKKDSGGNSDREFSRAIMNSPRGMAYVLWLSIRINHPDVSFEEIQKATEAVPISEIARIVDSVHSVDDDVAEELDLKN